MNFLRSALFLFLAFIITSIFGFLVAFTGFLPLEWRYRLVDFWRGRFMQLVRYVLGIRIEVRGRENIPAQAAVVLSKHQSALETVALQDFFPRMVFVMKRELLLIPFLGWGLGALGMISINRKAGKDALQQVIDQGRASLARGCSVIVFPEGTRVAPGEKRRYKPGGAVLARATEALVVPVAHNAGEVWRRNAFVKQPGTVTFSIGPAFSAAGLSEAEISAQAEAWIEAEMRRLSPHRYPDA